MTLAEAPIEVRQDNSPEWIHPDPNFQEFLDHHDLRHVEHLLTPSTPWLAYSMEISDASQVGIRGTGGLGVLEGDIFNIFAQCGIPLEMVTPIYPLEIHQRLDDLRQTEYTIPVDPTERGFTKLNWTVSVRTAGAENIPLDVYEKRVGNARVIGPSEPAFREVYADDTSADHRLYQEVVEGFGGFQIVQKLGIKPPVVQLNEAPTVFAVIAELDDLCQNQGLDFDAALQRVRSKTIYTNHTLVQAVEARFSDAQFEAYVLPNVDNPAVQTWVRDHFRDGSIQLSSLALDLAGRKTGVSKLHAETASREFFDIHNNPASFEAVTNGIDPQKWGAPSINTLYHTQGITDSRGSIREGYTEAIAGLSVDQMWAIKRTERTLLRDFLRQRKDQRDQPITIPEDALILNWNRRFAGYKRPGMLFEELETVAGLLERNNIHVVISGRTHPRDEGMKTAMKDLFLRIEGNDVLRSRVHYVQDYDEETGSALSRGSDISLNTPEVKKEACGTSIWKIIYNWSILVSTHDGGVADVNPPQYMAIAQGDYETEVASMYALVEEAAQKAKDKDRWGQQVKEQLTGYLDIISGAEMAARYLQYAFPKAA